MQHIIDTMNIAWFFVILYLTSKIESKSNETDKSPRKSRSAADQNSENSYTFAGKQRIYEDTVEFTYYTKANRDGTPFKATEAPISALEGMDVSIPLIFITHESTGDCKSMDMCKAIKTKYIDLDHPKYQVITADYSILAAPLEYLTIAKHAWRLAEVFAFVIDDVLDREMSPSIIHMIGFGLGAHICGYAAELVNRGLVPSNNKIGRITGLDPPVLYFEVTTDGIQKDQADFVDIVHTSINAVGIPEARGHVDFYPNAGLVPQPGCEAKFDGTYGFCSHRMSWHWFHKSIGNTDIKAHSCTSFTRFTFFECTRTREMIFGDNTPRNARGVFYFKGSIE